MSSVQEQKGEYEDQYMNSLRDATIIVEAGNVYVERYHEGKTEAVYPGSFNPQSPSDTTTTSTEQKKENPTLLLLTVECTREEMEKAEIPTKDDEGNDNRDTLAFILCGPNVRIPLSQKIVVVRSQMGKYSFVLPEGVFITFIFPSETPQIILEEFEDYLDQYTILNIEDKEAPNRYQNTFESKITGGIGYGGETISTLLINGATVIGSVFKGASDFLQQHISPSNRTNRKIFPPFRWLVHGTRFASRGSVKVSGSLMNSVIYISSRIGKTTTEGTVSRIFSGRGESGPHLTTVKNIGRAGVAAVGNVFDAVEKSTDIIFSDATDAIASGMAHRYGDNYGELTRESIGIATDINRTYQNVRNIGRRPITHAAAKSAAKSSINTMEQQ